MEFFKLSSLMKCHMFQGLVNLWSGNKSLAPQNGICLCCTTATKWINPSGDITDVLIYNPITKTKVPFVTKQNEFISWYACGPTVYDSAHIGHACSYLKLDIIRRILEKYVKKSVIQVMCVTDIDDKIIQRAKQLNIHWKTISEIHEKQFFIDLAALNIKRPMITSRCTDFIPQIIRFIQILLDKNIAYKSKDGSVYFSIEGYGKHGKLLKSNERHCTQDQEILIEKRCPSDFVLWKSAKINEPNWEAPWGCGRPGWHTECSTIASEYFGNSVDIHTGGIDLMFPHHENEESQCCAFHDVDQWVNYWLHTGHLTFKNEKMSKSSGNTVSIKEYLDSNSANHLRMLCLYTNYRTHIDFYDDEVSHSVNFCSRFYEFFNECSAYVNGYSNSGDVDTIRLLQLLEETKKNVDMYLIDDFNTAQCVDQLLSLISEVFSMLHAEPGKRCIMSICLVHRYVEDMMDFFGFNFCGKTISNVGMQKSENNLDNIIDSSVTFRNNVRATSLVMKNENNVDLCKNGIHLLEFCDKFRQELLHHGVVIKDRKNDVTTWSYDHAIKKKKD